MYNKQPSKQVMNLDEIKELSVNGLICTTDRVYMVSSSLLHVSCDNIIYHF